MSTEVIKILDYLCAQLGITIDWTAENVWPQVMDFMGRYQIFAISKCGIWVVLSAIICICGIWLIKTACRKYSEWGDELTIMLIFLAALVIFGFGIAFMCNIFTALEWGIVPEMKFIDMLSGYLK